MAKRMAMVVVLVAGLVAMPLAQGASKADSDKAAAEKAIVAAEQKVIEAIAKGDLGAFKGLVSSDGWSISPNGPMANSEFEKNFKQAKIEPGWKINETRVIWVASNSAVLLYKWTGKGTFMGQPLPPVVYSSTVWHRNGDKWVAVFHQETAAAPGK
jgi:hypothetical protein